MGECKILDLAKPILKTWTTDSFLEAMALLQEDATEWMFDNYINLMGKWNYKTQNGSIAFIPRHDPELKDITLCSWVRCPFIEFHYVSHNFVKNMYDSILEYIICALEEGYYICINILQESLSKQAYGQKEHKPFIYGYDKKRKVLFVADHYSTEKYELATLGFEEFLEAYEMTYWDKWDRNLFVSSKWDVWEQQAIYIARVKPFKYEFNIDWFKLQLKDYLDSTYRLNSIAVVTEGGF